jgi:hypothetical protein
MESTFIKTSSRTRKEVMDTTKVILVYNELTKQLNKEELSELVYFMIQDGYVTSKTFNLIDERM